VPELRGHERLQLTDTRRIADGSPAEDAGLRPIGATDNEEEGHVRRTAAGSFEVGLSAADVIGCLTPEGERAWVPGWEPVYPAGEPSETVGTVFTTDHAGAETIWVVIGIDRTAGTAAYTRVTPGQHAGTVRVHCVDTDGGRCRVDVSYDMSLLAGADPAALDGYEPERFAAMLRDWAEAIATHLHG
jgi:hypothetical protein